MNTKDKIKISFLGTGTSSGIPLLACKCDTCRSTDLKDKRLRSSIFIEHKGKSILIDIGPDFRQQMLRENIDWIDAILITHSHNDHVAGIDEIRAYNFAMNRSMNVYTNEIAENEIKAHFDYIFRPNKYPGIADVNINRIDKEPFFIEDIEIIPVEVIHGKLPITAFRIGNFAYVTDIKSISEEEFNKLKGVTTLVVSALRHEEHFSHFTYQEAVAFVEKLEVEKAYFNHLSHRFEKHEELEKILPNNISIAFDGLKIVVD